MPALTSTTYFDILRKNQTEPVTVYVKDAIGDLTDVVSGTFNLIDIADDSTKVTQVFGPTGTGVITHPSTGVYQYSFNATTYLNEYLLTFNCTLAGESVNYNMFVKSVSSRHFAYAAALRNQIDKSQKSIFDDIENIDRPANTPAVRFMYGYSDAHLIYYLDRGIQLINAQPPYTWLGIDTFPFQQYGTVLLDAATIAALEAQGIFAIDTDFDYSLGGNSLVIDHFGKLNTMISTLLTRFDKMLLSFKQQYRSKGLVMFQFMPGGVRSARQLSAMPAGWWSRLLSSVTGV